MAGAATKASLQTRRAWLCGIGLVVLACSSDRYGCPASLALATLTLVVLDRQTGEPVCDAVTELFEGDWKVDPEADPPECQFVYFVGAATYQLTVEAPGYASQSQTIVVPREGSCDRPVPSTVEIKLDPA
ncbi:MAG: hypothetical protein H6718_37010 [Polyangiaceae bacterium]|nr:hypothetical protein [Myxococcales bacterium]MCB9591064.1 hypothetical protein [Polyangiaceae bacterium]